MIQGMNHFTILAEDRDATLAFYCGLLGLVDGPRPPFDFPGAWLYDPLSKRSRANTASAKFNGSDQKSDAVIADLKDSIQANQSLTIEAFVKPSKQAGGNSWLVGKSRAAADGGGPAGAGGAGALAAGLGAGDGRRSCL